MFGHQFNDSKFRVNAARQGGIVALRNRLIANGTIRADQGQAVEQAVVEAARRSFNVMEDLQGLTRNLGSIGILVDAYERRSKKEGADIGMRADRAVDRKRLNYDKVMVPIPVYVEEFSVDIRESEASTAAQGRGVAEAIDTAEAEESGRSIMETFEQITINGADVGIEGAELYGVTNHPHRNTANLVAAWTAGSADPVKDVINAIQANRNDGFRGPMAVWYPDNWHSVLIEDYSEQKGTNTVLQRMQAIPQVQSVRSTAALTDSVVVCQLTRDVVDLSIAQGLTVYPWEERGGLSLHWASIFAAAARFKSDIDGNAGFCVLS